MIIVTVSERAKAKKTKIVATIGPATEDLEPLREVINAGVNIIRLNFSHGDHAEHQRKVDNFRIIQSEHDESLGILVDLGGPKIRIGDFYKERVELKKGSTFTLTTKKIVGDENNAYVNYSKLPSEVSKGGYILLDDGKKRLQVVSTTKDSIKCKVIVGGETKGKRGVNVPGANLKISSLTAKDLKDVEFAIKNDADFIALSFVRNSKDIVKLRGIIGKAKKNIKIVAKIETEEAVENIEEIIRETDAVMVARGDLAIEIGTEHVPMVQKKLIKLSRLHGKPVITATQMLESMIKLNVPTRAEVSDIANAILDGTDAVMLSEETTLGKYPKEAVTVMRNVALEVESRYPRKEVLRQKEKIADLDLGDSVSDAVVKIAEGTDAKNIVVLTKSGDTARSVARFRALQDVIAFSSDKKTCSQLALSYGVRSYYMQFHKHIDDAVLDMRQKMVELKVGRKGSRIVISSGSPFDKNKEASMLLVESL